MMANFIAAILGAVAVISVFCQGGFGMHVRPRCVRICEQLNGFPEHLKGFPGKARHIFSAKSDSERNFIFKGCDCTEIIRNINHRNKRSVYSSTQPTPPSNTSKNTSEITNTSEPVNEPDESGKCIDPQDRDLNRTWRAHNITQFRAKNERVEFIQNGSDWYANITWIPPEDKRLYGYLIIYSKDTESISRCKEIMNNKTNIIIDLPNGWEISDALLIGIFSLPGYLDIKMEKWTYNYFRPYMSFNHIGITLEPPIEKINSMYGSVLAGSLAGILLIVILVFVLYRRKTCGSPGVEGHSFIQMQENNNPDGFVKINNTTKPQNNDIYFASYLPENEKFSNEVASIAYKLGTMGYRVTFDKVDSVHMNEIGFNMWVDKQILEAKKYIVFCTPAYVRLWQSLASSVVDNKFNNINDQDLVRVRYEIKRISDVYSETCSTSRIVCIKMDPKMSTKLLPPWMNHNMLLWPEQKEDVIRRLNDQAAMVMHM